jgi:hypothetical protein
MACGRVQAAGLAFLAEALFSTTNPTWLWAVLPREVIGAK